MKCKDKTFVKITNGHIYKKLCDIEEKVTITNGKVKLNRWIATTALTISIGVIGVVLGVCL